MTQRRQLSPELMFMAPVAVPDLIRMGKDWDGGYVISASSVDVAGGMFSFGVNNDWSFDQEWRQRKPGDRIHAYDGTISPGNFPPDLLLSYQDFFGTTATHFPVNIAASSSLGQSSFQDAWTRLNTQPVFIKMDIEGGEWQLTSDIMHHAHNISGMLIEFHNTAYLRTLFCDTIRQYQEHFHVIHIHPNTSCGYASDNFPEVVEISFLNRSLWADDTRRLDCHLPGLDQSNLPNIEDVSLFWRI